MIEKSKHDESRIKAKLMKYENRMDAERSMKAEFKKNQNIIKAVE